MKRIVPVWILATLPAALVGHALTYRLLGESMADGRHAYVGPLLELTIGLLALFGIAMLVGALLRSGRLALGVEGSFGGTWLKLAAAQTLIFALCERCEGHLPSLAGCAVQGAIALLVTLALLLFARLLARCTALGEAASHRVRRFPALTSALHALPMPAANALGASLGTHRFQRPPPFVAL